MFGISRHSAADLSELYSPRSLQVSLLFLVALAGVCFAGLTLAGRGSQAQLLLLAGAGFTLVFFPRAAFYVFLVSLSLYMPHRFSQLIVIYPYDLALGIAFLAVVMDFLLRVRTQIRPALFDGPFLVLIAAGGISALFAHSPGHCLVPLIRLVVIFIAFRLVFKFALEIGVRRITLLFIYLVFILALINTLLFFISGGGTRIFGPSVYGFETFCVTALNMALAFLIWSKSPRERRRFGFIALVIGFGVLATQSRAPVLAIVLIIPLLVLFTAVKARREETRLPLRTMKTVFIPLAILLAVFLFLQNTLLAGSLGRYEQFILSFSAPRGSVALRIALWGAAFNAFLDNPITGLGIGNFKIVHDIYPNLVFDPLWYFVKGLSAHNIFLHHLAETGLVGLAALLVLAWRGLRVSYLSFKARLSSADSQVTAALFIAVLSFVLYMRAWTWGQTGYIMAILFGLSAAWTYEQRQRVATSDQ
ncbi:MAG: O-antigen ligase family protein [candidate division Zixibacteria bacterium]|nr:O-antigen ligase family protein [candidate division Zixibacteria bacterium]